MNIGSIIKIVFLSTIGLVLLTYLTVEPPKIVDNKVITLSNLPDTVELIGYDDQKFKTASIIKPNTILFVGNHESIAIAKDLENMLNLSIGKFVIISNISDAPWFIKRWQAHTKNIKLKGKDNTPWIYDKNGAMRNYLKVPTSDAIKYFVYNVKDDKTIERIYIGKVKAGTIDGKISKEEIKNSLQEVVTAIKDLSKK